MDCVDIFSATMGFGMGKWRAEAEKGDTVIESNYIPNKDLCSRDVACIPSNGGSSSIIRSVGFRKVL
jgi:hypothetical protein